MAVDGEARAAPERIADPWGERTPYGLRLFGYTSRKGGARVVKARRCRSRAAPFRTPRTRLARGVPRPAGHRSEIVALLGPSLGLGLPGGLVQLADLLL